MMMERKIVCDLNLVSVDFGQEEELRPGNTFRIAFRHANGQPTGTIEVYQGEADHFIGKVDTWGFGAADLSKVFGANGSGTKGGRNFRVYCIAGGGGVGCLRRLCEH